MDEKKIDEMEKFIQKIMAKYLDNCGVCIFAFTKFDTPLSYSRVFTFNPDTNEDYYEDYKKLRDMMNETLKIIKNAPPQR